jgi:hypothetical protein
MSSLNNSSAKGNKSIRAAIKPYRKESTYKNIFSFPVVLWIIGYICFNFYLEWDNWQELIRENSIDPPNANTSTLERWMLIDPHSNAAIAHVRLAEVCKSIDIFDAVFMVMCAIVPVMSVVQFILRQQKIFYETLKCSNGFQWFLGFVFLAIMRAAEATVAFVLISLLLPSSFFMCYKMFAMYFCTLSFALLVVFMICVVLTSAISHSVLVFDVNYTSLGVIGKDAEIDVIHTKRRKVRKRSKFKDKEAESLIQEEAYSDKLDEEEEEYIDERV